MDREITRKAVNGVKSVKQGYTFNRVLSAVSVKESAFSNAVKGYATGANFLTLQHSVIIP